MLLGLSYEYDFVHFHTIIQLSSLVFFLQRNRFDFIKKYIADDILMFLKDTLSL